MNTLFGFILIFVIMGLGLDIMFRGNPTIHGAYRRTVSQILRYIRQRLARFVRWAWHNYRQFIVGFAVGVLTVLYFTGHFQ